MSVRRPHLSLQQLYPWFSGTLRATRTGGRSVELSRRQSQLFCDRLAP